MLAVKNTKANAVINRELVVRIVVAIDDQLAGT